jgi:subtilisin family serine protease
LPQHFTKRVKKRNEFNVKISWIKKILLFIIPGLIICFTAPEGRSDTGDFRGEKIAVVGSAEKDKSETTIQAADSGELIDMGDYYFLNTGEKRSFLREKNAYIIIRDNKKKKTPAMTSQEIQNRFGDRLDIVKENAFGRYVKFRVKKGKDAKNIISALRRADKTISSISPSLVSREKGSEIAITPYIIASIDDNYNSNYVFTILKNHNLLPESALSFTKNEFKLKIRETVSDTGRIFKLARTIAGLEFVKWAEPNFIVNTNKMFIPDDPLFGNQWHLHNTGQNGAAVDADVDAPEGWNFAQGDGSVIAIYDDGVDTLHEDIAIWSNSGETGGGKETNETDDDGNGYIDDYQGWDFSDNDNDPGPASSSDNHGTSVAGVAGAVGNDGLGVSGSAPGAYILPVRMTSGTCGTFADAMRYAGKYADVVSNSWTIDACESSLNSAIDDVVTGNISGSRRGALGTPVLFASGNNASGWIKFTLSGISAGTHTFQWKYTKDQTVSSGYDTVWLDDITWPGGEPEDFESDTVGSIPDGFTSSGRKDWEVVNDGIHARGALGNSVKAGTIRHRQETNLDITKAVGSGSITFWAWVSSEQFYDFFEFYFNGTRYFQYAPGQYGHDNDVGYPASNPDTIAVGASNDGGISGEEERSYYSQFGSVLDVVAPSSGGGQGITTTDRMGSPGYSSTNYTSSFGGTSSATPLVSGIAAVIIADDPLLTSAEVRTILHDGADKIGPYAYPGGRNDFYGYGRVNLRDSVCSVLPVKIDRIIPAYYSSIQNAYIAAADGETILVQEIEFTDDLDFNLNKSVTLKGGYDCDHSTATGRTILNHNVNISNGTIILEGFEIL